MIPIETQPRPTAEDNLRAIVSHDADGAIIVDSSGTVRFLNSAAEKLLDRHGAELHGQIFGFPLVVGERAEVEVLRPNGEFAVAEMRVLSIVWEGQDALLITLRDVTFERQAEAALREAEAFSIAILNSLTSEIVVLDEQGKIVAVNEAWLEFGRQNGVTDLASIGVGADYFAICAASGPGTGGPEALQGLQAVLAGQLAEFTYEYPCPGPQGMRWFALRAVPLRGERQGLVIAHNDITAQRRAAQIAAEAEMLREQVRQMERELVSVEAISRPDEMVRSLLAPLRQRDPERFQKGLSRYGELLEAALASRVHRTPAPSRPLRELGEWLGTIWAAPRDLIDIHLQAMRERSQHNPPKKLQAYFEEGRLILLELMGHLASYYRSIAAGELSSRESE
ncbi:PAS domain-containing protein [Chloroflexus sp.]|uniref:PAS domain-containing protein n=1 Tax=Chloroflexus sp. TaxID=1904827 RepID=UPI00298EF68E|nr:PAS domain-containing protein [Chloroflexus sp.]MDW8403039.1 PAS domain-containing protein [Chloroflexus sp.]